MEDKVSTSASGTVRRMEKAYHEFVVENYSLRKGIGVNQLIENCQFVVGGHQWTIYLYPDGKEDGAYNVEYASLYICLKSETIEPTEFVYELDILDQTGKGRYWEEGRDEELYSILHKSTYNQAEVGNNLNSTNLREEI